MDKREKDVLTSLLFKPFINKTILAELTGLSLYLIDKSIKNLIKNGYLDEEVRLTLKAKEEIKKYSPKNAIILAAGFGTRMVPINFETPKALIEINGEVLIERIIRQLNEVGITNIIVVVGFLKEKFLYLVEKYGIEIIINKEFATKNNLYSMSLVVDRISNTYIIPCDIWCSRNPFRQNELYSWYMVSDFIDNQSNVKVNRNMELISMPKNIGGNSMIGISYLTNKEAEIVKEKILIMSNAKQFDASFWEEALFNNNKMIVYARTVHYTDVFEINTYEQLRNLDENSNHLKSEAISEIINALKVLSSDIINITVLKKGMTNRSFLFSCKGRRYIMRIPGEGTDLLINREAEAQVYQTIKGYNICDDIVYINPKNGYKISAYFDNSRVCNPDNVDDLIKCMKKLREFHKLDFVVNHEFDVFKQIEFYESLWKTKESIYNDYKITKENVFKLKKYIDKHVNKKCLTHIDAIPDNFLFLANDEVRLIDWEYASMQDPHVDIAMFCIYSLFNKQQIDQLIDIYFENKCTKEIRLKIYCYIAICGLLWSNWCEYKRSLGVEFGEYSYRQYCYAKDFFRLFMDEQK